MRLFALLAVACAVFYGSTFEMFQRFTAGPDKTVLVRVIESVGWLVPVIVCGAIQYRKLTQDGTDGARLWLSVTGTAFGAPVVGAFLMLMVVFAVYGKAP